MASTAVAGTGVLGTPPDNSIASGVGVISGYHCTSKNIEIFIDGVSIGPAGAGTRLLGTQEVCGRTDTGFSLLYAYNNLSDGQHTITAYADGVQFDSNTITTVKSGGQNWLTGANKTLTVADFPSTGKTTTLRWVESYQNFIVIGVDSGSILTRSQALIGTWLFQYTIASSFYEPYKLVSVDTTTVNSQGGYSVLGTNQYGASIVASYWPSDGEYSLLDQGASIDKYYSFTLTGGVISSGCHYQINRSTGTWSICYPLTGGRIATTNAWRPGAAADQNLLESIAIQEARTNAPTDASIVTKYQSLKQITP